MESLLVTLAGVVFALAANQFSPRGLSLTRNYFPATDGSGASVVRESPVNATHQTPAEALLTQIKARGLQLASSSQVVAWFHDPRRQTHKLVFIDARNDEDFQKGRIPGAWLFDPYHPEQYFTNIIPVCQAAEQIVVYCHGGDCDDSLTAAGLLLDIGIPGSKIAIYGGGMNEWPDTGLPVETGVQNSAKSRKEEAP
jgi:rhodanese-related sulfurtransferase